MTPKAPPSFPDSRNAFAFVVVGEIPEGMTADEAQRLVAMFSTNAEVMPHLRASFLRACPGMPVPELVQRITTALSPLTLS